MNSILRAILYIAVDVASDYAKRKPEPKADKTAKKAHKIASRKQIKDTTKQ